MHVKTRGIVLHSLKYSETSVIAKIYTEKLGLQSYLVKGVRVSKSKSKAAILLPLTLLEMEVLHRENKLLQYIKEFRRAVVYQSIPFDTLKSTIAFFLLEVVSKAIREHEPNGKMFEFIYDSFCALDSAERLDPDFHLLFLIQFSRYLGFAPQRNFTNENRFFEMGEGVFISEQKSFNMLNSKESELLNDLLENVPLKISRADRKIMMNNLLYYYKLHLENFSLKSPEVLEEILG